MRAVVLFIGELVVAAALVNSVVRFSIAGFRSRTRAGALMLTAGLSSLVTLLAMIAIYADAFRRVTMEATVRIFGDGSTAFDVRSVVAPVDRSIRDAVNFVNPGNDVGYRPHPSWWPIAIVVVSYVVRWLIYVAVQRRGLSTAAVTGAAYWSHLTGYASAVGFLVVVARWNAWLVVVGSGVLIGLVLLGLVVVEDFALLIRTGVDWVWHYLKGVGKEIARAASAFAARVRATLEQAQRLYIRHIRAPLRRFSARAVESSHRFEDNAQRRLEEEDRRQNERFREEEESPESGPALQ